MNEIDLDDLGLLIDESVEVASLDIDLTPINLTQDEEDNGLPDNYFYVQDLVFKDQLCGLVPDDLEGMDDVLPMYAEKNGEPINVGFIRMTAHDILKMQRLGLTVSIQRKGKNPILFDKAEQLLMIAKTLKEEDRVDYYTDFNTSGDSLEE